MARADYGSWSKFNGKIVTEKEQLEIINKIKKADNVNYYADAILSLCDGKYILSYFKGYYFTFHIFNGKSYDHIDEDSIIKVFGASDYKYRNKGANSVAIGAFYRPNENTMLSIGTTMGSEKMFNAGLSLKFGHHDKMNSDTKVAVAKEVQDLARKYEDLSQKYDNLIKLLDKKEATKFKSDLSNVEENQQYKITRVDNSDTEKGRIERIKTTRK